MEKKLPKNFQVLDCSKANELTLSDIDTSHIPSLNYFIPVSALVLDPTEHAHSPAY